MHMNEILKQDSYAFGDMDIDAAHVDLVLEIFTEK